jgi:pimeloyl-ACP methyl ester carboxylesterase
VTAYPPAHDLDRHLNTIRKATVNEDWGERAERWRGIRSEIVDVAGTQVHLLRADGPADGPTQLLVHGLGGSGTNWLEVMKGLADVGPVIAPDLPGFGRTEPPNARGSRIRSNLGFLRVLARQLGIERATVHGNSMGGLLSVQLAASAPELVERLVLIDPALPARPQDSRKMTKATLQTFAPFVVPTMGRRVMGKMYATMTAEQLFDDNQAYIHADPSRLSEELRAVGRENTAYGQRTPWRLDGFVAAAESLVAALIGRRGVLKAIDAIQAPTLVVWGDRDQLVGKPVIDALVGRRADFELRVLEGVGHAPMVEAPDDFLEVVTSWYREQDALQPPLATSLDT